MFSSLPPTPCARTAPCRWRAKGRHVVLSRPEQFNGIDSVIRPQSTKHVAGPWGLAESRIWFPTDRQDVKKRVLSAPFDPSHGPCVFRRTRLPPSGNLAVAAPHACNQTLTQWCGLIQRHQQDGLNRTNREPQSLTVPDDHAARHPLVCRRKPSDFHDIFRTDASPV